jgi:hypothetical protein
MILVVFTTFKMLARENLYSQEILSISSRLFVTYDKILYYAPLHKNKQILVCWQKDHVQDLMIYIVYFNQKIKNSRWVFLSYTDVDNQIKCISHPNKLSRYQGFVKVCD